MLALALLPTGHRQPAPLVHEVYVWQRQWDDSLRVAVIESGGLFAGLRVLALQFDQASGWIRPRVDLAALARDARPVVLVLRIDGATLLVSARGAGQRLLGTLAAWRAAGVRVAGVEIDHDTATARLPEYAAWLRALRPTLPGDLRLSITALPTWRNSAVLDQVLAVVDASVLQVHAVLSPSRGLFDPNLARAWIADWARINVRRPFFVALPAYGLRLRLDGRGGLDGVAGEQPLRAGQHDAEVSVDPRAVALLMAELEAKPPPMLAGFVWFRLPRQSDRRAWSLSTLTAVIKHRPLRGDLQAEFRSQIGGAVDLSLHNLGSIDVELPWLIRVPASCRIGDGVNGYHYNRQAVGVTLELEQPRPLRAGDRLVIGWLRCDSKEALHVHWDS